MKINSQAKKIILSIIILSAYFFLYPNITNAAPNATIQNNREYNAIVQQIENLQDVISRSRKSLDSPGLDASNIRAIQDRIDRAQQEIERLRARALQINGDSTEQLNTDIQNQEAERETRNNKDAETGKCFSLFNFSLEACVEGVISAVGEFFKQIFGLVLWLAGKFFDKSVEYSVASFSTLADSDSIKVGWKTLRDVANLFFIFILLYAAIGMILQLPSVNGKRILVSVIVVALLINFSAFFTRLVIDSSNVAANQFYNAVSKSETARIGVGEGQRTITGISATFMNALPIHSVLAGAPGRTIINAVGISFGAVIMMLVAIFIFLAAAILFVVRTVTLLFLIILSPLAFLMYAFPNQKGLFDKWLDTLLKQAFFAPLYLLMVWVTIKFLKGGALQAILAQEGSSPVLITLNFLIAIGFMFGALIIAKSLGAKGASAAMKGAGALTGAATGAALWGSKQLRRAGVAAGAGVAGGVGAIFGKGAGIRKFATSQLKDIKTDTQKVVTSGQGKIGKAVREFAQAPIKKTLGITVGGLAAVTKDYGIGGILGRTKDEEAEARKKEKERKEAENKAELKRKEDQLRGNPRNAASIMASIKDKDISEIDSKVLVQHGQHLRASQLAEASKHLDHNDRTAIRNAIIAAVAPVGTPPTPTTGTPEQRQAYEWLTQNNAGKIF